MMVMARFGATSFIVGEPSAAVVSSTRSHRSNSVRFARCGHSSVLGLRWGAGVSEAVVHHAASVSGLPVPSRTVALAPDTAIESWAPTQAVGVDTEVLEWIAGQMRGKRRSNGTLMRLVATIIGAATLPLAQIPNVFDIGM